MIFMDEKRWTGTETSVAKYCTKAALMCIWPMSGLKLYSASIVHLYMCVTNCKVDRCMKFPKNKVLRREPGRVVSFSFSFLYLKKSSEI